MNDYLRFLNQDDQAVIRALEIIKEEKTFPKAPEHTETIDSTCVQ
jgi:hypothetical protein